MPALKCDFYMTIRVGEESFSIGGVKLPDGKFAIKRGRSWSKKIGTATLSQIFAESRKWAVKKI